MVNQQHLHQAPKYLVWEQQGLQELLWSIAPTASQQQEVNSNPALYRTADICSKIPALA
jgi:hypothetical protein